MVAEVVVRIDGAPERGVAAGAATRTRADSAGERPTPPLTPRATSLSLDLFSASPASREWDFFRFFFFSFVSFFLQFLQLFSGVAAALVGSKGTRAASASNFRRACLAPGGSSTLLAFFGRTFPVAAAAKGRKKLRKRFDDDHDDDESLSLLLSVALSPPPLPAPASAATPQIVSPIAKTLDAAASNPPPGRRTGSARAQAPEATPASIEATEAQVQTETELPSLRPAVCRASPAAERAAEAARPRRRDKEAAEAAAAEAAAATASSSLPPSPVVDASRSAAAAAAFAAAGAKAKPARHAVVERPKTSPALSPSPGGQGRFRASAVPGAPPAGRETNDAEGGEEVESVTAPPPFAAAAATSVGVFGRDCSEYEFVCCSDEELARWWKAEVEDDEEDLSETFPKPLRRGGEDECEKAVEGPPFPPPPFVPLPLPPILSASAESTEGRPRARAEHARITEIALAAGGGGGDASGGEVAPSRAVPTSAAAAARHSLLFSLSPRKKWEYKARMTRPMPETGWMSETWGGGSSWVSSEEKDRKGRARERERGRG